MGIITLIAEVSAAAPVAEVQPPAEDLAFIQTLFAVLWSLSATVAFYVVGRLIQRRAPLGYERRRPVPWQGQDVLAAVLLWIGSQAILPHLLLRLAGVAFPGDGGKVAPEAIIPLLAAESVGQIFGFLTVLTWLVLRAGGDWQALGFELRRWPHDLLAGLAGAALIVAPVLTLNAVLQSYWPSEHPLVKAVLENPQALLIAAIMAVLLAPLTEEFVFRVLLQGWLEKVERRLRHAPAWPRSMPSGTLSIVISSAAFAAMHIGHGADPIPLFFLALVLGYLYHQTHRIWPSLVVHLALNSLTTALLWTMVKA